DFLRSAISPISSSIRWSFWTMTLGVSTASGGSGANSTPVPIELATLTRRWGIEGRRPISERFLLLSLCFGDRPPSLTSPAPGEGLISDVFSSSAAVISQPDRLNNPNGGRDETDRVLKMRASVPRSRLIFSRPSSSESVLYVLTFIVLRLQG